ncbi:glycosyltransferase [Peribacillus psychrosaccharolyticus]|uniref:glycosyltransferase family 2 protein n=1 Tax=Peribacillus psychrosaccharolyticus TaxID=1407 RepID=UPI003D2A3CB6
MISVVLPVYNVEQYLNECLESVFCQTHRNFELIIVNDGSTDRSIDIIDEYRKRYTNLVYLEQENKGLSEARNLATSYAKGEYVIYIDSDDYMDLNMLELMYNRIVKIKGDVVVCGHKEIHENVQKENSRVFIEADCNKSFSGVEVANMLLSCKVLGVTWNKLIKMDKIKENCLYFEPGRYTQDWYPIFKIISNCEVVGFVNKDLYNYRIREGSVTAKKNWKRLNDYNHATSSILNYVKNSNLQYNNNSITLFKAITFEKIIFMYISLNKKKGRQLYKEFKSSYCTDYDLSLINILSSNKVSIRRKLNLILWKCKILHTIIK